jgi:hypothetical protein
MKSLNRAINREFDNDSAKEQMTKFNHTDGVTAILFKIRLSEEVILFLTFQGGYPF